MAPQPEESPQSKDTGRYPRPAVSLDEAETVWRDLASASMEPGAKPETVRLAVIVALTRATGARYSDLLRCGTDSFDLGEEGARSTPGTVEVFHGKHRTRTIHPLDASEVILLRRWLEVRAELCAELEGSSPRALLLTVHHTHDNGTTVVSGLPITKQGLVLSWRRHVHRTNARWAGRRLPLPTRFEQVRRAWTESAENRVAVPAVHDDGPGKPPGPSSNYKDVHN